MLIYTCPAGSRFSFGGDGFLLAPVAPTFAFSGQSQFCDFEPLTNSTKHNSWLESLHSGHNKPLFCSVLLPSSIRGLATTWTYFLHLSLSSVILTDSSTDSRPRLDVVNPSRAWSSSPACTWHCSLHYLFLQATPLFPHGVTIVC